MLTSWLAGDCPRGFICSAHLFLKFYEIGMGLTPIHECFFPTPPGNSPAPAGCLTIQLDSDTIYMETVSDPTD